MKKSANNIFVEFKEPNEKSSNHFVGSYKPERINYVPKLKNKTSAASVPYKISALKSKSPQIFKSSQIDETTNRSDQIDLSTEISNESTTSGEIFYWED